MSKISGLSAALTAKADYNAVRVDTTTIAGDVAGKQDAITGAATSITSSDLTADRALLSDGSGKVSVKRRQQHGARLSFRRYLGAPDAAQREGGL